MSPKEDMDHVHLMTVVTVEKELTELLNLDHITTRDFPKDKKQFQDHTVEYSVQVAWSPESSEHSYSSRSKQLKRPKEQQQKNNEMIDRIFKLIIEYFIILKKVKWI